MVDSEPLEMCPQSRVNLAAEACEGEEAISPLAVVHPSARIGTGVRIGPWSLIGPGVEIGADTTIGPHVVIAACTVIGKRNTVFSFSSIGDVPQHATLSGGEHAYLVMGDDNVVREGCIFHRATQPGGHTAIGQGNFFMAHSHVAHDCWVGNHTVFVNSATIGGHVHVEDYVTLGAFCGVHQHCRVGMHSFISGGAMLNKDVLPYMMVFGNPPRIRGLNKVGLKRRGMEKQTLSVLDKAYKIIYRQGNTADRAVSLLKELVETDEAVSALIKGLLHSSRGILR